MPAESAGGAGTLHVVATPLGNLGDLSPRALEVLREADLVVAEDTRHTRGMLTHFGVHAALASLPAFAEKERLGALARRLVAGEHLALVTDAGTPGVSDPGALLVDAAWEVGARVIPVPGPSAALAALCASGLDASRFFFAGFLPRKGEKRREELSALARLGATVVLFEAGNRLGPTLGELALAFGERRAMVARELTKLHEELVRAPLSELARRFEEGARGEVVVVVEGAPEGSEPAAGDDAFERLLGDALASGERLGDVAKALAAQTGRPRQEIYGRLLELRRRERGGDPPDSPEGGSEG